MKQPRTWWAVLGRLALFILALACAVGVAVAPLAMFMSDWANENPRSVQLYSDVSGALAMLAATWLMTRFVDKRAFHTIGFSPQNVGRDLLLGLAAGAAWLVASIGLAMAAGWASFQDPEGLQGSLLALAAVSVLFNVVTQELLLCGYILQTIKARAGLPTAIVVSALLFSALHVAAFEGQWIPPLNVFLAGLVFCTAYGITGNLWLPIAIHFAWNLLLGPVFGLTVSGNDSLGLGWRSFEIEGPDLFTGGNFGLEGGLIVTITTAIFVVALSLFYRRKGNSAMQDGRGSSGDSAP